MSGNLEIVKAWIEKGDHDFGTAKITYLHLLMNKLCNPYQHKSLSF